MKSKLFKNLNTWFLECKTEENLLKKEQYYQQFSLVGNMDIVDYTLKFWVTGVLIIQSFIFQTKSSVYQ